MHTYPLFVQENGVSIDNKAPNMGKNDIFYRTLFILFYYGKKAGNRLIFNFI